MNDTKRYEGSCHCGNVRFEVTTDLGTLTACNCSMCSRMGWRLTFVQASQFHLLSGEDALTDYQFAKKNIHHLFCSTCGVRSFCRAAGKDGGTTYGVNVRCLAGVEADSLPVSHFDGKSL
ncbi:MAG: GFA family protein [Polyangiaceae bacterium]